MRAIVLKGPNDFSLQEMPIPVPRAGQVLIRIEASPINPSDIVFLKGLYGTKKPYPAVPGFEASGTVVSSGGGLLAWRLVGKKVAVAIEKGDGVWAEFAVASAKTCVVLNDSIPFTLGCNFFANPLTAMMFMEKIKEGKHAAIVQTAACSAIGKMMVRYCKEEGIPCINIVRRQEQVDLLRSIGAEHVLDSSTESFQEDLKKLSVNLNATLAFDCVSGEMTGHLVNNMCEGSVVYVYGSLSMKPISAINPSAIIFSRKRVEGLWLSSWIKTKGIMSLWNTTNKVVALLPTVLKTDVAAEFKLEEINEALQYYKANMTAGKVVFRPQLKPGN